MPATVNTGDGNIVADAAGNSYQAVSFPKVDSLNNVIGMWPLITKRSPTGEILWSKHLGKDFKFPSNPGSKAIIKFANDGGILVAMTFYNQADQLPVATFPANAAMVTKLNTAGVVEWTRAFTIPSIRHIIPGTNQLETYTRRNLTGMYVDSRFGVIILYGADGIGTDWRQKGFFTFLNQDGSLIGTRYLDLPLQPGISSSAPVEIVGRPGGGIIVIGEYSSRPTMFTSVGPIQTYAFRTGAYGAARGTSVLFGSSVRNPATDSAQTLVRPGVAVSRSNGSVIINNSIYESLIELDVNLNPTAHLKINSPSMNIIRNMERLGNTDHIYLYTKSATLSGTSPQWPRGHTFTDGHAFILGPTNQIMEEKYFGFGNSSSSLSSGTPQAGGYHLLSFSNAGRSGVTVSAAGVSQTYFNEWKQLSLANGATFEADLSRTCYPSLLSPIPQPQIYQIAFGLGPIVPQQVLIPVLQTTDATDVVWKYVRN